MENPTPVAEVVARLILMVTGAICMFCLLDWIALVNKALGEIRTELDKQNSKTPK